jgi:succinate-semialdehyde dehydrogenase/glutarate-semialdehyde dehydrogenase
VPDVITLACPSTKTDLQQVVFTTCRFLIISAVDDVNPACAIIEEEPFAPLMPVMGFDTIEDVIEQANSTKYGLAAYVFTNDLSTAFRMADGLEAGIIGINDPVPATPQCPFGGMKESGIGRELGQEGLEAYLETKYVAIRIKE